MRTSLKAFVRRWLLVIAAGSMAAPVAAQGITYTPPPQTLTSLGAAASGDNADITATEAFATLNSKTNGWTVTRQETTPTAASAALVSTASGNCTNGTHVFAVVVNTPAGHTDVSASSAAVTCDGTHKQVTVTIPTGSYFTSSRDVYASKAGTTTPLFLVATSPVVNDNSTTSYTFNLADASLTATTAPSTNTAIDNAFQTTSGAAGGGVTTIRGRFVTRVPRNSQYSFIGQASDGTNKFEMLIGGTGNGNFYIYDSAGNVVDQFGQSDTFLIGNSASNAAGIVKINRLGTILNLYPRSGDFGNFATIGPAGVNGIVLGVNLDTTPLAGLTISSDAKTATVNKLLGTLGAGNAKPTVSSCGTGTVTNNSTDNWGEVTATGATSCTVIFNAAYPTAAFCTIEDETSVVATRISAISTSQFTVTGLTSSDKFMYHCGGN